MANKPLIMPNFYAPKTDMTARPECMNVVALPDPDIGQIAHQPGLSHSEVVPGGNLHVRRFPCEDMDAMPGKRRDGGIIREIQGARRGRFSMCGQDQIETERLWRLHCPQPRAWRGRNDRCLRINLFNCIG